MIEINIFTFILLLKNRREYTNALKYFLIQAIGRSVILWRIFFRGGLERGLRDSLLVIRILLKIGLAPFHIWYLTILLRINYINILIIITLQKILPIYIIMLICSHFLKLLNLVFFFNILVIVIIRLKVWGVKIILGVSRVYNCFFILLRISEISVWLGYIIIYFLGLLVLILILRFLGLNQEIVLLKLGGRNKISILFLFFSILNLRGIPPIIGFLGKIIVIQFLIKRRQIFLIGILILCSVYVLYIYIRFCYLNLLNISRKRFLLLRGINELRGLRLIIFLRIIRI